MGAHDVVIDDESIAAGFAEFDQGEMSGPGTGVAIAEMPGGDWISITNMIAAILADRVVPNWSVGQSERAEWSQALAECLDQLMPGGIGNLENWGPWAKLLFASASVGLAGFDWSTGAFKPMRVPTPEEISEELKQAHEKTGPKAQRFGSDGFMHDVE